MRFAVGLTLSLVSVGTSPGCGPGEAPTTSSAAPLIAPERRDRPSDPAKIWITIGKTDVSVDLKPTVPLPEVSARAAGVDAKHKRDGANGYFVTPLAQAVPACHGKSVAIEVEPDTPFRLLLEVVFTLGSQGCASYDVLLAGAPARHFVMTLPSFDRADSNGYDELSSRAMELTAFLVAEGISLKLAAGAVGPTCEGVGPGLTLPLQDGRYPVGALTLCAAKLKKSVPALKTTSAVTLTASPAVPCSAVIDAAQGLQRHEGQPLFPEIILAAAR